MTTIGLLVAKGDIKKVFADACVLQAEKSIKSRIEVSLLPPSQHLPQVILPLVHDLRGYYEVLPHYV